MQSVEKEGMKLYVKLCEISGDQSSVLQGSLEDCDKHGAYNVYCLGFRV